MSGITNRSAVEDDEDSDEDEEEEEDGGVTEKEDPARSSAAAVPATAKLRQYAEAIQNSDTAASFSKVSTNWRAAAVSAFQSKPSSSTPEQQPPQSPTAKARDRFSHQERC